MTEREQWETKGCRDGRSEGLGEVAVATYQSEMVSDLDKIVGVVGGFPGGSVIKNLPAKQETWVQSLGKEDPLEKEMQPTPVFLHQTMDRRA